jgi:hypothetical protein
MKAKAVANQGGAVVKSGNVHVPGTEAPGPKKPEEEVCFACK